MGEQPKGSFDIIVRKGAEQDAAPTERADFIQLSPYLYGKKVSLPADTLQSNIQEPGRSLHLRTTSVAV